jgi:predicted metal-binding membrane protein
MSTAMPMPGDWSMSMAWMRMASQSPLAHAVMFLVMWAVMMIAMMLPSVMPAVLLHQRLIARRIELGGPAAGSQVFLLAGYFAVWVVFGMAAYAAGMTLAGAAMRSMRVSRFIPAATGAALVPFSLLPRWTLPEVVQIAAAGNFAVIACVAVAIAATRRKP